MLGLSHNIGVVAHLERADQAHQLMEDLPAAYLTMDNGSLGCEINHRKAWTYLASKDAEWGVVLEDDALPVPNFREQAEQALAVAPSPIVSLYLGRHRPPHWMPAAHAATDKASAEDACFITCTHLLHAVAVAIKTEYIQAMLDHTHTSVRPWDYAVAAWALSEGIPVSYTHPSLVEHQDGPTVVKHPDGKSRTPGRVAWKVGTRDQWTGTTVTMNE